MALSAYIAAFAAKAILSVQARGVRLFAPMTVLVERHGFVQVAGPAALASHFESFLAAGAPVRLAFHQHQGLVLMYEEAERPRGDAVRLHIDVIDDRALLHEHRVIVGSRADPRALAASAGAWADGRCLQSGGIVDDMHAYAAAFRRAPRAPPSAAKLVQLHGFKTLHGSDALTAHLVMRVAGREPVRATFQYGSRLVFAYEESVDDQCVAMHVDCFERCAPPARSHVHHKIVHPRDDLLGLQDAVYLALGQCD